MLPFIVAIGDMGEGRQGVPGGGLHEDRAKGVFVPPWLASTAQVEDDLAAFQATIKYFDERVGEILDALAASDRFHDTVVVMTSDHGIPYPGAKWTVRKAGIQLMVG